MKLLLYTVLFRLALGAWQDGAEIKSDFAQGEMSFLGSFEGHADDHLTILDQTESNLFVGARDTLYNLSLTDLAKQSMVTWTVSPDHQDICQLKGQKESECHNFIRLFHGPISPPSHTPSKPASYLVCGTHAYKPKCRWYDPALNSFSSEFSGIGYSPFSPSHPSTSLLHHNSVYTATVADFGGMDSLIYKQPLRTEQNYDLQLSSPSFVSSMSLGDLALFFFKEVAVENSNCGKAVFSRVGRICRHDSGSRKHKDRFTTFLKARLNCSIPGEFPFYFDHIQSTTDMFLNGEIGQEMLYAVFSTPPNSIHATAVCAFTAADILKAFDGPFKGQSSSNSNWLPVPENKEPQPRPGRCSNESSASPDLTSAAFIKSHPLMDEAVQGTPILTITAGDFTVSSIVVDASPELAPFHIIYLGTESGKVVKAVVNASAAGEKLYNETDFKSEHTVISQSWEVFPGQKIKSLKLSAKKQLIAATETGIRIVPVHNCERFGASCGECVALRDPHCAWNLELNTCVHADPQNKSAEWVQNVHFGFSSQCPSIEKSEDAPTVIEIIADKPKECCSCSSSSPPADADQSAILSRILPIGNKSEDDFILSTRNPDTENASRNMTDASPSPEFKSTFVDNDFVINRSVVLATTSSAGIALLIGFTMGFIVARILSWKRADKSPAGSQLGILNESRISSKQIDFVLNVPTMNKYSSDKCNTNTRTLEKTVKKVYL